MNSAIQRAPSIFDLLPFNQPSFALSGAGSVPYNTVYGTNLRDQLIMQAKQLDGGSGGSKGVKGTGKVKTYEQARNEALSWLEQRGFKSEKQTFGKFGYTKNEPIGRQTNDGKIGFRIEHDSRSGAHINVWAGKEKGPHFEFEASEKTVKKIQKRFK